MNSYTNEDMLKIHKPRCENIDMSIIRTSNESHAFCKNHIHKKSLYFRVYADFEADNEIDNSSLGNKTTIIYRQNPILNGYGIVSELEDVLESGY